VDWRNKKDQANNRSSTIFLEIDGERQPVSVWAQRVGTPADTIRKRLREGASPREAVYGRATTPAPGTFHWPEPQEWWEREFQASGARDCRLYWLVKKIGHLKTITERRLTALIGEDAIACAPDQVHLYERRMSEAEQEEVSKLEERHGKLFHMATQACKLVGLERQGRLPHREFWHALTARETARREGGKKYTQGRQYRSSEPNPDGNDFPSSERDDHDSYPEEPSHQSPKVTGIEPVVAALFEDSEPSKG
jgi:hypothetical protein